MKKDIVLEHPLSESKKALLEKRLRGDFTASSKAQRIPKRSQTERVPLSFAQQRLWFLDRLEPNSSFYNMPSAFRLRGELNHAVLQKALSAIIARHETLRTRFESIDGNVAQVIGDPVLMEIPVVDLTRKPPAQRESEIQRLLREEAGKPFNLSCDLMLRARLLRVDRAEHILILNMHHIASDGWSLGIFYRELAAFYDGFCSGRTVILPELPVQYADFSVWQRDWLQGKVLEQNLAYWKRQLDGAPDFLELPTDRPRPVAQTFHGGQESLMLPPELARELKFLGRQEGVTLFMLFLAAFQALLFRYSRAEQILVGSPIAGRNQFQTEGLIGFFVNTLALRGDFSDDPTFRTLLQRICQMTLEAFSHQDLPFERLVEELRPNRSLNRAPLVQVMFVFQNAPSRDLALAGLSVVPLEIENHTSKFDLTLCVEETEQGLKATMEYNSDLFHSRTIARMLEHYRVLLEGVAVNPGLQVSIVPLLSQAEQDQLLVEWNDTTSRYPKNKTVHRLFELQADQTPDAIAIVFRDNHLTYRDLNARANQLAHHLHKKGIGPDAMVGICMERSVEMFIGLLGILKAGGAYVSMEPNQPEERRQFMLDEIEAKIVLTQEAFRSHFQSSTFHRSVICLDADWKAIACESMANPVSDARPENLAYVSFTSGSTGKPKGVCVPHRGVVRLVKDTNYVQLTSAEIFLQLAPVSFDASTFEIWGCLLNGGRLVVFPPQIPSLAELAEAIQKHRITTLWLTTGLFHQMVEEQIDSLRNIRQLLSGGDVLSVPHVRKALKHLTHCRLVNAYGPTENTTFTTCYPVPASHPEDRSVPIGRPISNTKVYVLDTRLQPVPVGVPGELFIGGDGLAAGYLKRPELTSEKFIPDPFTKEAGTRLYRTGDLVRYLSDGNLEFLGRLDFQVKIRGFRIEPGEIEAVLHQHSVIQTCCMIPCMDSNDEKRLVAYVVPVPGKSAAPGELRRFLQGKLPDYMVPAAFVSLEKLPLNPNGKVDRRALPPPDQISFKIEETHISPKDPLEIQLAEIWEAVLGKKQIGSEANFFELGGHSLLAVRLVAQIERRLKKKLPLAAVFQAPTIRKMANWIRNGQRSSDNSSLVAIQSQGSKKPLFLVHGVGGGMFWGYNNLSRYLGPDQPVFVFKSRGMDGLDEFSRIEDMAAQYIADLKAFQAQGPYYLGGYCFGGNVAFEMAQQLQASGEKVAFLALLNCAPPNTSYARVRWTPAFVFKFLVNFCNWMRSFCQWTPEQRHEFIHWKIRVLRKRAIQLFTLNFIETDKDLEDMVNPSLYSEQQRDLWAVHVRALNHYHPKIYRGSVNLFRTRPHQLFCSFDSKNGWGELVTEKVIVHIVDGAHESILREPHVQVLADELRSCLAETQVRELEIEAV